MASIIFVGNIVLCYFQSIDIILIKSDVMIEQNENESDISGMSRQGRLNYKDEYGEPKTSEEKQLMEQYGEKYAEGFIKTMFKD